MNRHQKKTERKTEDQVDVCMQNIPGLCWVGEDESTERRVRSKDPIMMERIPGRRIIGIHLASLEDREE